MSIEIEHVNTETAFGMRSEMFSDTESTFVDQPIYSHRSMSFVNTEQNL
jgi:hypothetical protein